MKKLVKFGLWTLGLLVALLIIAFIWMQRSIPAQQNGVDVAVEYANQNNKDGAAFRSDFFQYQNQTLHYVSAGEGDVVLFLHGFPSFWYSLIRPMQALKDDYQVVAIDGLGKGRSSLSTDIQDYKMGNMIQHIMALLDHLGAEKVHLVGHDWGNALAFGIAQRYPERVKTLSGLSAPPQSVLLELVTSNEEQAKIFAYVDYFRKANPLLLWLLNVKKRIWEGSYKPLVDAGYLTAEEGQLFQNNASNPKRVNANIDWYRANLPPFATVTDADFWPSRKAQVQAPTLFIWGEDDHLITSDTTAEIASITPQLTLLPLPDVGHRPQFERAKAVSEAIKAHLQRYP